MTEKGFNTGHCNTGDWNTGNCNAGYRNTGNYNTGDRNIGDCNAGNCNVGDRNTGIWNTGDYNRGNCNVGNHNTGDRNTGSWNRGNHNTGSWNMCSHSTGFFNTKERTITIFNIDSGMTFKECLECDWYRALCSVPFYLTEWVEYSDEEKEVSVFRQCIGGYLERYSFKEACANWWSRMSDKNKALIQTIPNFDKGIFEEITGIEIGKKQG